MNTRSHDLDLAGLLEMAGKHGRTTLDNPRREFHRTAYRNLLRTRELIAILDLFATRGIPALPYKGPVLAAAEYGNVALRTFCDLDILVRREQVQRAQDLLVARGYEPEYRLSARHEAAWLRARNDINLHRPDLDVTVELHWEVVPRRLGVRFDNDRLWARTQTISIAGRAVRTLSPENLLLVLCVHGAKHGWSRLMWISDVARVVTNHPEMNWSEVFSEARCIGAERMLTVGLRLASDVAGCALPDHVRRTTEDRATRALADDVRNGLFSHDAATPHNPLRRSLFHLKIQERFRDKLRFALYTIFVPSAADRLLVALPAGLTIVYYLLRPFRLARKYLRRPFAPRPAPTC
jgi:hypothetical protein